MGNRHFSIISRRSREIMITLVCTVLAATLTGAGTLHAQAAPTPPAGQGSAPAAAVGTGFTYQGRLTAGGNPANGQYDFRFTLFDALTGGNQIGNQLSLANQTVSGGLFTVSLDFGASAFQGDARYLQIEVRQTGGGTYTLLTPRQPLTPAPYALGLRPGATISGALASPLFTANNTGSNTGVYGASSSGSGGEFSSATGYGVHASGGTGVYATGGNGIYSIGTASNGVGLWGVANTGTTAKGVYGTSTSGFGIYGSSTAANGAGVYGTSTSSYGVSGAATGSTGGGVYGSGGSAGVFGTSVISNAYGVWGVAYTGSDSRGVYGYSGPGYGLFGGSGTGLGIYGTTAANNGTGILGFANAGATSAGVSGVSGNGYGIYGSSSGWAGYFQGNVNVTGTCCGSSKEYTRIDDPIDPENKYLDQALVQSPDMLSMINGNAILDSHGEANVTLPAWFEAANGDYRYTLTAVGAPGPDLYIAREVAGDTFKIAGGKAGGKVSWQITGVRTDPYAEAHPVQPESDKSSVDKGKYLHPAEYGQPESKGIKDSPNYQTPPGKP